MLQAHVSGCQGGGGSQFPSRTHRGRDKGGVSFLRDEVCAKTPAPGHGILTDSEPVGEGQHPRGRACVPQEQWSQMAVVLCLTLSMGPDRWNFSSFPSLVQKPEGITQKPCKNAGCGLPDLVGSRWGLEPLSF